jgi:hypothetical protein
MTDNSFNTAIEFDKSPHEVFSHLKEVSKWWTRDFEGRSANLNDEFVISHGDPHYSKHKLIEIIPDKKIVWLILDSKLNWLKKDQHEWTNTKMIFELTPKGDNTILHYTHQGLVPEKECYERCAEGWTMVIRERLYNYITNGITV